MTRAAIAIGSNSTRLLVADKRGGALHNIYRGREETRLFLGLDESGALSPERLEETARAVARLAGEARSRGAEAIALLATSATRDARNRDAFAARVEALSGLRPQVISGEEEARLAFFAAAGRERRLVMDIGGGSTELTWGENGAVQYAASAQMGASRLLKACPIASFSDAERALGMAKEALAPLAERALQYPAAPVLIGLGGSCTTAAAIAMGRMAHGDAVEGRVVTAKEAWRQLRLLSDLPLEARMRVPGLPPARAVHMPHGLCILLAALTLLGREEWTASGRTNLDGYLLSLPD